MALDALPLSFSCSLDSGFLAFLRRKRLYLRDRGQRFCNGGYVGLVKGFGRGATPSRFCGPE